MTCPMNGTAPSSSASPLAELSAMLRASADVVERGEFHPVLMQTILHLNVYTSEYAEGMAASASSNNETSATTGGEVPSAGESGAFCDVPDSAYRSAPNTSTSATAAVATGGYKSKMSSPFILKGMKKTLEKVTAFDKPKFVGEKNGVREEIPFDESRKASTINNNSNNNDAIDGDNITSTTSTQQQRQHQRTANNNDLPSNNVVTDPSKPARPSFQRPINPSSNLIANGWIDQQRRSKMRVVWKDVLASLVEGRRPGEETTLWIQRQVIDYATMKVTGLEALHQIPMKWLEDVNYVDLYGDHQFTLKVYNIAEEFFFRTRDEQSAQSWVLTLRSARDASLEGNVRMAGASEATEKRPTAKDMGLHDLEDWDTNDRQQGQGGETTMGDVGGGISPPQASSDSRPSEINQQEQQQQQKNQAPARLSIAELRAIAHGVGYNTRGMERQDLERIAAYVLNSVRQNPTPTTNAATTTAPTASAGVDGTHQRMQQEAVMREAEQRAMAEMRERELAQKSQEEARRQKEIEELAALERMRREREESEKHRVEELAEQQRRQRQDLDAQIADNKRRQEEERHRKMAELQAQQQSQAATERIKREEEERRRVHQQQQQQQQQRPSSNPTPPTSNGYPQNQQQWQQQQQQWQQQQQQQQHPGQQQRPNSNPSPPTAGGYPPNQQQWQQQQQQQQQWQNQHHQQPPRPPPSVGHPPSGDTGGNNARGMPGVQSKYAKQMDGKSDGDQVISASTLQIKRAILINWALQPPSLNALRPIDQLITTIHSAMPPAYGVGPHEYFTRFTPITRIELIASPAMGNHPDETKLKKAVRKVKVFLHPDKLPRDFTSDQAFVARMLWDITSDSWEEFQKHKDELDWIRG